MFVGNNNPLKKVKVTVGDFTFYVTEEKALYLISDLENYNKGSLPYNKYNKPSKHKNMIKTDKWAIYAGQKFWDKLLLEVMEEFDKGFDRELEGRKNDTK